MPSAAARSGVAKCVATWSLVVVLACSLGGGLRGESCLAIPDQRVVPGQERVWFPVLLSSDDPIQGFQLHGTYDARVLRLDETQFAFTRLASRGTPEFFQLNNPEGRFEVGTIFEFEQPLDFTNSLLGPAREERLIHLVFTVAKSAEAGTRTRIELVNDPAQSPVANVLMIGGFGQFPCLRGAAVEIVGGNPRLFQRGDADQSGAIELSDAVRILGHLFLGDSAPRCLDAADFGDSGSIDIGDAVSVLNFLFLGGSPPAVPFPNTGLDPTEDALSCE